MGWKPEFETVVQLSPEERKLFRDGDSSSVFDRYRLAERRGINRSGEFPVAALRGLYDALGYDSWFSGQAKLGSATYLLTRMPGKRRQGDPAFERIVGVFGRQAVERLNQEAEEAREAAGHAAAGGDPDLFVFSRRNPSLRFFVEVKLDDRTTAYRDALGDQQLLLFPLIKKHLKCGVRLAHVQITDAG